MRGTTVAVHLICDLTGMAVTGCLQEFQALIRVMLRMQFKWNDEEIKAI